MVSNGPQRSTRNRAAMLHLVVSELGSSTQTSCSACKQTKEEDAKVKPVLWLLAGRHSFPWRRACVFLFECSFPSRSVNTIHSRSHSGSSCGGQAAEPQQQAGHPPALTPAAPTTFPSHSCFPEVLYRACLVKALVVRLSCLGCRGLTQPAFTLSWLPIS